MVVGSDFVVLAMKWLHFFVCVSGWNGHDHGGSILCIVIVLRTRNYLVTPAPLFQIEPS